MATGRSIDFHQIHTADDAYVLDSALTNQWLSYHNNEPY